MPGLFSRVLGREPPSGRGSRERLTFAEDPAIVYAIGDVHGRIDLLRALEERIVADAEETPGEKWIVLLGDLVDRGAGSAAVLDHVLAPAPFGFSRQVLAGNHEAAMQAFLEAGPDAGDWLGFGGLETLASYGLDFDALRQRGGQALQRAALAIIPNEHEELVRGLPVLIETPSWIFVHAGLRPGRSLAEQDEQDLLWIRDHFRDDYTGFGKTVVHGHTPIEHPKILPGRIAIDTGACFTGRLTAVKLVPGRLPEFFQTGGSSPTSGVRIAGA